LANHNESSGAWKIDLARELGNAGFTFDLKAVLESNTGRDVVVRFDRRSVSSTRRSIALCGCEPIL
jgi:hypothetical protein